jgi:DNA-binding NtrC family response regulator
MRILKEEDYNTGELNWNKFERSHIIRVVKKCRGKKITAAMILGITEKTFYNKIKQHSIQDKEFLN